MNHLYEYLEFDQLSDASKKTAMDKVRDRRYHEIDSICRDAVEDDFLFEPPHSEMTALFGDDYEEANGGKPMIMNTRKNISFVGKDDPNYYIHCADAIEVTNDNLFLRWLGIPPIFRDFVYYTFDYPGRSTG